MQSLFGRVLLIAVASGDQVDVLPKDCCQGYGSKGGSRSSLKGRQSTMKEWFTTGQVAKLLQLSIRKICNMYDEGTLSGQRLPGKEGKEGDRRISRASLIDYFCKRNLALPSELEDGMLKVLLISAEADFVAPFERSLCSSVPEGKSAKFFTASSIIEGCIEIGAKKPHVVILDFAIDSVGRGSHCLQLAKFLHDSVAHQSTMRIALLASDSSGIGGEGEFHDVFRRPIDEQLLCSRIFSLLSRAKRTSF